MALSTLAVDLSIFRFCRESLTEESAFWLSFGRLQVPTLFRFRLFIRNLACKIYLFKIGFGFPASEFQLSTLLSMIPRTCIAFP